MGHEPRRPAFFWVTVLACAVYLVLFAFSTYATVKYWGVRKYPGWSSAAERWPLGCGRRLTPQGLPRADWSPATVWWPSTVTIGARCSGSINSGP